MLIEDTGTTPIIVVPVFLFKRENLVIVIYGTMFYRCHHFLCLYQQIVEHLNIHSHAEDN